MIHLSLRLRRREVSVPDNRTAFVRRSAFHAGASFHLFELAAGKTRQGPALAGMVRRFKRGRRREERGG